MSKCPKRDECKPIEDVLAELAAEVPPEAWDALPDDLTDRLDDYLYGSSVDELGDKGGACSGERNEPD